MYGATLTIGAKFTGEIWVTFTDTRNAFTMAVAIIGTRKVGIIWNETREKEGEADGNLLCSFQIDKRPIKTWGYGLGSCSDDRMGLTLH